MKHAAAESYETNEESEYFQSIVDNLVTIAEATAADPERTLQMTMQKVEIPGLGLLYTQQIFEELHIRVTHRPERGSVHGKEIDCLYNYSESGWHFADTSESFKITTARPGGGMHAFYHIQRRGDEFVQIGENDNALSREDIIAASDLAANFANRAPDCLNS